MKKFKSFISILLCIVMTLQITGFTNAFGADNSSDYENHWAKTQIDRLIDENIINGYSDNTVKPDNNISRAEFVTLINKSLNYSSKANSNFQDISDKAWYADQFLIAKQAGYLVGDNNGNANPTDYITRAEVCVIVSSVLGLDENEDTGFSDDASIAAWAKPYIGAMSKESLINGYPDGSFGAVRNITRAESFVIICNMLDYADDNSDTVDLLEDSENDNSDSDETEVTEETVETTTVKRSSSGGGSSGGGSSSSSKSTTEATTETTTTALADETTETTTEDDIVDVYDPSVYTKGEWIKLLDDKLEIDVTVFADLDNYEYADSADSEYGLYVEAAEAYGLLPDPTSEGYEDPEQDVPLFNADETATREFAAYTVVSAMGFVGEYTLSCSDASSTLYPSEMAVAVEQGIIKLDNNMLYPKSAVTGTDKNRMYAVMDKFNAFAEVDLDNQHENVELQEDVVYDELSEVTDYTVTENSDGTYTVVVADSDATAAITEGKVFILPGNDTYSTGIALIADSITNNGNGTLIIIGSVPELEDVFSEIDFEGLGIGDVDNFETAEGVSLEYDPNGSIDDEETYALDINADKSISVPGKLTFTVASKKISDDLKVSGKISVEIPDITCKVNASVGVFSGLNVDNFVVSMTEKIKLEGELAYTLHESGYEITNSLGNTRFVSGKVELGRLPIQLGTTGLSADVVFFYYSNVKGSASISYTIVVTEGLQVTNGSVRLIKDFTQSMDAISLKGSAKVGLGLALRLDAFSLIDLIGVDAQTGLGVSISFTAHVTSDGNLYCGDGTIYQYLTLELDTDTAFGTFVKSVLHTTYSWDIWNENNSPNKFKLHFENGEKVSECTWGAGSISGYVYDSSDNSAVAYARVRLYNEDDSSDNSAVAYARVRLYNEDGSQLMKTMYTDASGHYSCSSLLKGDYILEVSATGCSKYESTVTIEKDTTTYVETLLMVDRDNLVEEGTVYGSLTDAVTGGSVSDVNYYVRNDWNNTSGDVVTSGNISGNSYSITLDAGNYTLEFEKDGYVNSSVNIAISGNTSVLKNITLSPESGGEVGDDLRIVLTWGATPRDLDSHLYGPDIDGTPLFHIYYNNKNYLGIAVLDVDDTSSYGPETTTLSSFVNGTYSFYVHDFTNRSNSTAYCTELSTSGAQVRVYSGSTLLATYTVPTNTGATIWHVFDYNAETNTITPVNTMFYSTTPSTYRPDSSTTSVTSLDLASSEDLALYSKDYEVDDNEQAEEVDTDEITAESDETACSDIAEDFEITTVEDEEISAEENAGISEEIYVYEEVENPEENPASKEMDTTIEEVSEITTTPEYIEAA